MTQAYHRDLGVLARPAQLRAYTGAVAVLGGGVLVAAGSQLSMADLAVFAGLPALWIVMAFVLFGELRPILTPGRYYANGATTSTTFAFAVLLFLGLPVAAVLQAAAALLAGIVRRHVWWRTAFNVGQYTLSLAAAAAVFELARRGGAPTDPWVPGGGDLPVIGAAALAYFLVNLALVWLAVSYWQGISVIDVARGELAYQTIVTCALLGLSPLVVLAVDTSAWLVPLFVPALAAVYRNASLSRERDRQSLHDGLTGLPNRKLLVERSRTALGQARRHRHGMALLLLDLDRFKEVNDTLGHPTGDRLLQLVGRRLQGAVRPGDTIARLGGDEFAVLLPALPDSGAPRDVARRIVAAFSDPFVLDGLSLDLQVSVGIAVYPDHAADFESLLQRTDVAMYLAKGSRGGVEMYDIARDRNSPDRLALLADLRRAIDGGEVELHYQPKVAFSDSGVVGVEALVRWRHPHRGMISPDDFVPLAEQTGLMPRLTEYVVDRALAQAACWWEDDLRVPVAVNVSLRDVHTPGFVATISAGLRRYGVPASALQLEITERVLLEEPHRVAETLGGLRRLGVQLSLDDFGTGYSSLVHLRRIPVSEIKIDRAFVTRLVHDEDDAAIVRSMVDLAHALGVEVVAEGVETLEIWRRLGRLGCDAAQGWFVSDALPGPTATAWLERAR
ncbi:MAG: putative bifunctional diguanylate cyclase/phosphodiesterase, partial [Carbonactinosporaceae bacterium]